MTLEEAIDKAILAYMDGEELTAYNEADAPFKYNKKYFDDADERILPKEGTKK